MHRHNYIGEGSPFPSSSLRLIVPPLRMVSAAIWQTVQQKVVSDYGVIEEFITMVTEIIPELLTHKQRVLLILGLRSRLILDLCHSTPMTEPDIIKPHLERLQTLSLCWEKESGTGRMEELSASNFLGLIQMLLNDPEERHIFFQNTFPIEYGPKYDKAIQTLVWLFLSRFEKLLQIPKLQQVASMLNNVRSALEECVESVSHSQELKTLLEYHRDLSQMEGDDSLNADGDCILSALCRHPVEQGRILTNPTEGKVEVPSINDHILSQELKVECVTELTEDLVMKVIPLNEKEEKNERRTEEHKKNNDFSVITDENIENDKGITETVKYAEDVDIIDGEEGALKISCFSQNANEELASAEFTTASETTEVGNEDCEMHLIIGEGGCTESIDVVVVSDKKGACQGNNSLIPIESLLRQSQQHPGTNNIPKVPMLSRAVRPNRGLKMKAFLTQYRKATKIKHPNSGPKQHIRHGEDIMQSESADTVQSVCDKEEKSHREFKCTLCGQSFPRTAQLKCHMISHSSERPHQCSNCERSFKHISSMKAHEEACLFASRQCRTGEVLSGGSPGKTAMGPASQENSEPATIKSCVHLKNASSPVYISTDRLSQCSCCSKLFPSPDDFKTHQCEVEKSESSKDVSQTCVIAVEELTKTSLYSLDPACSMGGKIIKHPAEILNPMTTHTSDVNYSCPNCHKMYKYLKNFEKHMDICKKVPATDEKEKEPCSAYQKVVTEDGEMAVVKNDFLLANASQDSLLSSGIKSVSNSHVCGICVSVGEDIHNKGKLKDPLSCTSCCSKVRTRNGSKHSVNNTCKTKSVNCDEWQKGVGKRKGRECDECGKEFGLRSTLRAHKLTHNPLYCAQCRKVCPDPETLAAHNVAHKPVQCTMCSKSFNVTRFLIKHYLDAHQFSGPFACTYCNKNYRELSSLIRHERTHTGDLPFHCEKCPRRFNRHIDLVSHERKHTGEKPFLCWECGKAFSTNEILRKHMERHSHLEKSYSCPQCERTFGAKKTVDEHVQIHHKGMRFPCSYCGKLFLSRSALGRHDRIHTGEKPFKCAHINCGKGFRSSAELRIHTRYHTGERPFKCDICGKGFVQANYLTIHLRSHTQERPYACPNCDRRFTTGNQLNRHKLIHTGEKPFKCKHCEEAFNRKHRLRAHQEKHHRELFPAAITTDISIDVA